MRLAEVPEPVAGPGEVLIEVVATAVNRADLLQRQGHYPPPGGGYAERVVVPASQLLPGPFGVSLIYAAALPEATCTAWSNVFDLGRLDADVAIDYRTEDFVRVIDRETGGAGVDVILDNMGASYFDRNLDALADDGHLVTIGLQGGTSCNVDLTRVMAKRATVSSTALRSRPGRGKAAVVSAVQQHVWPLLTVVTCRARAW